jgi:hypothetical protein
MGRQSHRKSKRGGSNYSSAASYGQYVNGTQNEQFDRVFSTSGPYAASQSNTSIGAEGQNAMQPYIPSSQDLTLIQSAGKRKKRGGLWGEVINQAIVPVTLLGMQQTIPRRKRGGKKSLKLRKKSRSNRGKKTRRH